MTAVARERVLMLVLNLDIGGLERMVIDLSTGIKDIGYQVFVCALEDEGKLSDGLKSKGIQLFSLNRSKLGKQGTVKALNELVEELEIDVLHSHNAAALYYGGQAVKARRKLVHVWTRHGVGDASAKSILRDRLAVMNTNRIVAVSADLATDCAQKRFMPKQKIQLIENGINLEPFSSRTRSETGSIRIGHIARLSQVKNQQRLLRVFAEFERRHPDAKLIIVGDGDEHERLKAVAEQLKISDKVEFMGMRSDIPELLSSFDWFALSSDSEGSPISIIEAMAAGCPIVSTNVGGIAAMVRDGVDGILVAPTDEASMVTAWGKLAAHPELRKTLGENARQHAAEKFDLRKMVTSYEALYTEQLKKNHGS